MRLPLGQNAPEMDGTIFAELYQAHLVAVFNYCLFRLGERSIAEDLAADVFERAWRARSRYRPDQAGYSTWLLAIARNAVIDWRRRNGRHPLVTLADEPADREPLPEIQCESLEQSEKLRTLIRKLGAEEQELIALKFGAGLTNRQIAVLLQRSESAIGVALHRLIIKLRQSWEVVDEPFPL